MNTTHSIQEEFEDTKEVIRIRKSKKNRQLNGQIHNLDFWMKITQTVVSLLVEQELPTLQEHLSSLLVFSGFALIDL
jgi:hypothetical protein